MGLLSAIKAVPKGIVKATGKTAFKLKKASPQILVGGGIVIATGAFVLAIVNARKIDGVMAESESKVNDIEEKKAELESAESTDDEKKALTVQYDKDIAKVKRDSALQMFWLIGIPSLAFAGGMAMTIGGHRILVKRFGQLSVSFAALKESYDRYRERVIADHGAEYDRKVRYGIVDETETTAKITDESGNEQEVKCKVPVVDKGAGAGLYTFQFSPEFSRKCQKDPVNNISFLRAQERYWNIWMESTGKPVTLAMILNDLGIELDPDDPANDYILIAGWRPNGDGDNHIDFGIMRAINKPALDLEENVIMLEFNCDGNIYHSTRYTKDGRKVVA